MKTGLYPVTAGQAAPEEALAALLIAALAEEANAAREELRTARVLDAAI